MKKISRKRALGRLKEKKGDRGPVTVYLSRGLFKRFKAACGDHSASEVMEELIGQFIDQWRLFDIIISLLSRCLQHLIFTC